MEALLSQKFEHCIFFIKDLLHLGKVGKLEKKSKKVILWYKKVGEPKAS